VKTSSFFDYVGLGRISIARFPPRRTPPGFRVYRALAPGPWFNSVAHEEYGRLYADQLALLDPAQVWADLHELAGEHEPILLCWERPQDLISGKTFCHRRRVAEFFRRTLGHVVPEHGYPTCR
jgi:hypothetical protein